jgi:hypothetical protein
LFAASSGKVYNFTHNLGAVPLLVRIYYCPDNAGSQLEEVIIDASRGRTASLWIGAFVRRLDAASLSVETGGLGLSKFNGGVRKAGFLRIIAMALPRFHRRSFDRRRLRTPPAACRTLGIACCVDTIRARPQPFCPVVLYFEPSNKASGVFR